MSVEWIKITIIVLLSTAIYINESQFKTEYAKTAEGEEKFK